MGQANQMPNRKVWSFKKRLLCNPITLIGVIVLCLGVSNIYRGIESTMWPIADGTIVKSEVEHQSSGGSDYGSGSFCDDVLYQFKVDGKLHRGNMVAVGKYCGGDPSYAQGIVNRYPKGKNVKVHYRTSDPDTCLLEPGLHGQTWCVPFIGLVCFAGGILMTVFLPRFATPLKMRLEQSHRPPRG